MSIKIYLIFPRCFYFIDLYYILEVRELDYAEWFALRLAELRAQKGVSARDMSLSLGQSASYINKIENHRALPSMQGFFYICEYLEISPQEFFNLSSPDPLKERQIASEIQKLSSEKAEHIYQIIKDLNNR